MSNQTFNALVNLVLLQIKCFLYLFPFVNRNSLTLVNFLKTLAYKLLDLQLKFIFQLLTFS